MTAAAAAEGDSLARPGLLRGGAQRMHHHPTAKAMGVMVPTPCDLRVASAEGAQHKEVAAQPRFSKIWAVPQGGCAIVTRGQKLRGRGRRLTPLMWSRESDSEKTRSTKVDGMPRTRDHGSRSREP